MLAEDVSIVQKLAKRSILAVRAAQLRIIAGM